MGLFPHLCPVCKNHNFTEPFEDCPFCNWANDIIQEKQPDLKNCGNFMSLNEAKKAYDEGRGIL